MKFLRTLRNWFATKQQLVEANQALVEQVNTVGTINLSLNAAIGENYAEKEAFKNDAIGIIIALVLQNGGEAFIADDLMAAGESGDFFLRFDRSPNGFLSVQVLADTPEPDEDTKSCGTTGQAPEGV